MEHLRPSGKKRGRKPAPHQLVNGVDLKLCRHCNTFKPLPDFHAKPNKSDNLASWCRACARLAGIEWRLRRKHEPLPRITVTSKRCPNCETVLPASEFASNKATRDGLHAYCLACNRERQADERARRGEGYREMRRRYRATPEGRAAYLRYRYAHPTKHAAHKAVQLAVKEGRLVRPDTCSQCGDGGLIDSHHDDYAQQLDVRWLCRWCHQAWHRQHGEAANANSATL
jgi:ribosomal protein S27AE